MPLARPLGYLIGAAAAAAAAAVLWSIRDYRAWTALGAGGLPHTLRGWLRMTGWRLMMDDPLALQPLLPLALATNDTHALNHLPVRAGGRPKIAPHPVPHRQLDQHAPEALRPLQQALFDVCVSERPSTLHYAQSHFEKHNKAITLRHVDGGHSDACASCGEIAHIHPSDGSMHMILGASDAIQVVRGGWGERHGLAGKALNLPTTYTLIYAPRDAAELSVVGDILRASISHMAKHQP